jgi:hypothetical protein
MSWKEILSPKIMKLQKIPKLHSPHSLKPLLCANIYMRAHTKFVKLSLSLEISSQYGEYLMESEGPEFYVYLILLNGDFTIQCSHHIMKIYKSWENDVLTLVTSKNDGNKNLHIHLPASNEVHHSMTPSLKNNMGRAIFIFF